MITEVNRLCSDQQTLPTAQPQTGVISSEAILDNVRQSTVYDGRLHFIVQVTNTPAGGTSIQAKVQTSPDNSAWTDVADTGAVALANIPANGVLLDKVLTEDFKGKRYWRVIYVLVGTFTTAAKVTAGEFTEGSPHYRRIFTPGDGFEG